MTGFVNKISGGRDGKFPVRTAAVFLYPLWGMNKSGFAKEHIWADPSFWGVIAGNGFSIYMAITQGWDIGEIMWVYWAQSVIIGFVNFYRILTLKEFSTDGLMMNDKPVPETAAGKRSIGFFFLIHYGGFHLVYAGFLWQQMALSGLEQRELLFMALCAAGFAVSHGYSFRHNVQHDFKKKKPNLGNIMFYPYMRILPMHMTIIFGNMITGSAMVIFMVLKTFADVGMHVAEHALYRRPGKQSL